tara:strand:+ start:23427 stop:23945 length:519 start_codon:yes stop_codon:yes gene_type:complete
VFLAKCVNIVQDEKFNIKLFGVKIMAVQTSTGTLFAIVAAEPATIDQAGFAALTFVDVGEVTDVAEYGADTSVVTHQPLATGVVEKFKGFVNYGSSTVSFGRDTTDAGQALLLSGSDGINKNVRHSVRVTYQNGDLDYFTCKVFSFKKVPGSADAIVTATSNIEIESVIVEA